MRLEASFPEMPIKSKSVGKQQSYGQKTEGVHVRRIRIQNSKLNKNSAAEYAGFFGGLICPRTAPDLGGSLRHQTGTS